MVKLSGVQDELTKVSSERDGLQTELSTLEGKYKVMETLRDSQEAELQTLKVTTFSIVQMNEQGFVEFKM